MSKYTMLNYTMIYFYSALLDFSLLALFEKSFCTCAKRYWLKYDHDHIFYWALFYLQLLVDFSRFQDVLSHLALQWDNLYPSSIYLAFFYLISSIAFELFSAYRDSEIVFLDFPFLWLITFRLCHIPVHACVRNLFFFLWLWLWLMSLHFIFHLPENAIV